MKKLLILLTLASVLLACTSSINKEEVCGKSFTKTIDDPMYQGLATNYSTILNCDGTFESTSSKDLDDPSPTHNGNGTKLNFKGTWEIVNEIPENIKQAVIKWGKEDNDYSIIKYSSSNGVNGYCLFYDDSIEPLNTGQVSDYDWENTRGAAGIFGGFNL